MVIQIDERVLNASTDVNVLSTLDSLIAKVIRGHHELHLSDITHFRGEPFKRYAQFFEKHFKKTWQGPRLSVPARLVRIVLSEDFVDHIKNSSSETDVVRIHVENQRVSVSKADRRLDIITLELVPRYLIERLVIVVENNRSDKTFLNTVFRFFEGDPISDDRAKFDNGGGSSICACLEELGGRNRAICIIDGDVEIDGTVLISKQREHAKVAEVCEKLGYDLHILSKREIENYLPDEALQRWLEASGFRGQHPFFQLDEPHKDRVDMKKKASSLVPQGAVPISSSSSVVTSTPTATYGFCKDIWEAFIHVRSKEELERRDGLEELPELIELVKSSL
ncbi:hypothetical protein [Alicyclobacillus ferrooxydans]|uniref:Uncharacterized protein n=1 Tax=Alicyclobacillus ferrooxydans TaxID=471514 RepID=A0A0P9GSG4_9BACL|nr:hypothetical protein [Alicyclobacillus ferrooxydans]KPV43980.1 hypothetical protein AN477_09700 [Alicyclobacillus ferrooxydans]